MWATKAEQNLGEFTKQGWKYVEPARFSSNWHIDAILDHGTAILDRQLRRLIVTVPPRHMKSLGFNVFLPAFAWAQNPDPDNVGHGFGVQPGKFRGPGVKFGYISYAQDLSNDHSVKCRQLIESDWYQRRWGHRFRLRDDSNRITRFDTMHGGHRLALAFGGKITGFGADIIVVDDAHNLKDIESDVVREETLRVWDEVLPTRLNDPQTGVFVIIMQRSHQRDLAGHIIAHEIDAFHLDLSPEEIKKYWYAKVADKEADRLSPQWRILCLPARYELDHPVPFLTDVVNKRMKPADPDDPGYWKDPRSPGEPLWPERFPENVLDEWAHRLRPHAAAGQLQQRPTAREGGTFKRHWFGEPVAAVPAPAMSNRVRAWDLAGTAQDKKSKRSDPDWTVGVLMSLDPTTSIVYIENIIRFRGSPLEVEKAIINAAGIDGRLCQIRLPRDPGQSGKFQFQHLAGKLHGYRVRAEAESESKTVRADPFAAQCEAGNVKLVRGPWIEEFLDELCAFPNGGHDDQVDAVAGGYRVLAVPAANTPIVGSYGMH